MLFVSQAKNRSCKNNCQAKGMKKLRSSTVEPVLGTLINFTGMRRIYTRGIKQANKFMLCAAIAYNLKKYIRFITNKRISVPMQLKKQALLTKQGLFLTIFYLKTLILHYNHKNIFEAV
ncbi:MAG TPA: transposase [Bacteroidia bacterium]|nr:transposase [Bacteroidia bacterium]